MDSRCIFAFNLEVNASTCCDQDRVLSKSTPRNLVHSTLGISNPAILTLILFLPGQYYMSTVYSDLMIIYWHGVSH